MGKMSKETKDAIRAAQREFADRIREEYCGMPLREYTADWLKRVVQEKFALGDAEDRIQPKVSSVSFLFQQYESELDKVRVTLQAVIDYGAFNLEVRETAWRQFDWRGYCTGGRRTADPFADYAKEFDACMKEVQRKLEQNQQIPEKILKCVTQMGYSFLRETPPDKPGNEWRAVPKKERLKSLVDSVLSEVTANVQPEIHRVAQQAQEKYKQKVSSVVPPAGFQLVSIREVSCDVRRSEDGDFFVTSGLKTDRKEMLESGMATIPYFTDVCLRTREAAARTLTDQAREAISYLSQRICGFPVTFAVSSLEQVPGIAPELLGLLTKGSARIGHVSLKWESQLYRNETLFCQMRAGCSNLEPRGSRGGSRSVSFPWFSGTRVTGPKGELEAFPDTLPGLPEFCGAFSELVERAAADRGTGEAPEILLSVNMHMSGRLSCGRVNLPLKAFREKTGEELRKFVLQTAEWCASEGCAADAIRKSQLSALSRLNRTQLQVLHYIYWNGRAWFQGMCDDLAPKLETTKTYAGGCLEKLCSVSALTWSGTEEPLVRMEWRSSWKHGDYRLYLPNASIDEEVFQAAVPRDYTVNDLDAFDAAKQKQWFLEYLQKASNAESRWKRFSQAIEKMPRTFLVEFAKSGSGADFLRQFEGEEREFVKMYLENLPGCKKRAKEIFPD